MRFLHISDLHLGRGFSAKRYGERFAAARSRELLACLERIVEEANREEVDFILCAGDLLHSEDVTLEELRNINAVLDRLERAVFVAISGNHDAQTASSPYCRLEWTPKFSLCPPGWGRAALSQYEVVLHYYSWDQKELRQPLLQEASFARRGKYNILLLHGDALDPSSRYLPLDAKELAALGFDYVALGHIHQPQQLAPEVWYSGSPEPLDFGEGGEHGFVRCQLDENGLQAEFVPFSKRQYREAQVEVQPEDAPLTVEEKAATQMQAAPEDIWTLTLTGRYRPGHPLSREDLQEALRQKGFACQLADATAPDYDLAAMLRQNPDGLLSRYVRSFGPGPWSPVEERALRFGVEALLEEVSQWEK